MGMICSTNGAGEKRIQGFVGKARGKDTNWEDLDIGGRIILT
jgi:hypothetical protein